MTDPEHCSLHSSDSPADLVPSYDLREGERGEREEGRGERGDTL